MAKSKTFALLNGLTVEKIGDYIVSWFQNTKGMIAEGGKAQGGYFVQAKEESDGWKKMSGLTKALQVQFIKADDAVVVNCDFGKWSDKVGAGAIGMLVFAPLAVTAGIGAFKQSKLPDEVFDVIEKFILSGGVSAVVSIGSRLKDDEVECPSCKAKNPKGQKLCKECGGKLGKSCPSCGAAIDSETKFCPECGGSTTVGKSCIKCGNPLDENAKFCASCGTKQEKLCPVCGEAVDVNVKFCAKCGSSTADKQLCPGCKVEIDPAAPFCSECGHKLK